MAWSPDGRFVLTAAGSPDQTLRLWDGASGAEVRRFEYPKGNRGYTPFVRACARAAAGLDPAPLTGEDGLAALQTIFAAYKAAETGQTQRIG